MPSFKSLTSYPTDLGALPALRSDAASREFARFAAPVAKKIAAQRRAEALTAFERGDHSLQEMREEAPKRGGEKPVAFLDGGLLFRLADNLNGAETFHNGKWRPAVFHWSEEELNNPLQFIPLYAGDPRLPAESEAKADPDGWRPPSEKPEEGQLCELRGGPPFMPKAWSVFSGGFFRGAWTNRAMARRFVETRIDGASHGFTAWRPAPAEGAQS